MKDPELDYLWLTLRIEREDVAGFIDSSRPIRLSLVNPPNIMAIEPTVLPAGVPTTEHIVTLVVHDGIDPQVHAVRVGDSDTLFDLNENDTDSSLYFLAPAYPPGFQRLSIYLKDDWKLG